MDRCEQTVRRNGENDIAKDKMKYKMFFALAIVFCGLAALQIITAFSAVKLVLMLPAVLFALFAFLCFHFKDDMIIEYDYVIEDDTLTVSKIRNLSSRNDIVKIPASEFKRIEAFTPERYAQLDTKKYDCSLNKQNKKLLFFEKGSENCVLVFEPNDEMNKIISKELSR